MNDENAAALVTRIQLRPGAEKAFAAWHARMSIAPGEFPGFISAEIKPPAADDHNQWSVVQHFRSATEMRTWRRSDTYEHLLTEIARIVGTDALQEVQGA